jgi:lysophospholipase L1-like esterase
MKIKAVLFLIVLFLASFNQKEVTWTAIGDSITYLNDHQDETKNRISKGYMTLVTETLPNVHFINQGHNGWTAVGIAKAIDKLGLQKSDVYSVFLGTNDWWSGLPLGSLNDYRNNTGSDTFYGAYRVIIDKIKGLNPAAKVILITPMQRVDFVYISDSHNNAYGSYKEKDGQRLSKFANAVVELGKEEHFEVIDLYNLSKMQLSNLVKFKRLKDPLTGIYKNYKYPEFIDVPFHPESDEYPYPVEAGDITYDGLHPSDKGFQIIANKIVSILKKG